ncbi:WhiB family transcriptional regulator [Nocardia wallacei]|uniref:WhiB family transcriptional regulator n=1 Tax=Nocardia wallacei TaxID=480035 RepID=UPI002454341A|nr:WhiB family transcriptional regulator [Nocardia wallacei]
MVSTDSLMARLAADLQDQEDWQDRAVCAQTDPDAFYPEKGGSTADAKKVCMRCPVRVECLRYALDHDERFGIWGGTSERERRRIKHAAAAGGTSPAAARTTEEKVRAA